MNQKKVRKLREVFEKESGFKSVDRKKEVYKIYWRKFKKAMK